ncbi:MAG: DUF3768 domain-containing protein [Pseudomonadota bacterium]
MTTTDDGDRWIGDLPRCVTCGSDRVSRNARTTWNAETGLWEIATLSETVHCLDCNTPTSLDWTRNEGGPRTAVRDLNDRFRTEGKGNGSVVITEGLQLQGVGFVSTALQAVRAFDAFDGDNDPWGEHDFGAITISGVPIFWKLDYYTPDLSAGSENPAREQDTHRVLTIMLASEY